MPYLQIRTNVEVNAQGEHALLSSLTTQLCDTLGKSEEYFMASMDSGVSLMMGNSSELAALAELKSIGLPKEITHELSAIICGTISEALEISPKRIYVNLESVEPRFWGWDGDVF